MCLQAPIDAPRDSGSNTRCPSQAWIAAIADDGSYLIYVTIQAVSDDDAAALDRIVSSFIAGF